MLKTYREMREIDVRPYCDVREEGKERIPYLGYTECIDLLHENGADKVYFSPIRNAETGSSLISSGMVFEDSTGKKNSVYETAIHIVIDDLEFDFQGPVMNGANPVKDNSMSQQRLWNSQCRLFVKGVAIHVGLGFDLWLDGEKKEREVQKQEDMFHDIMKVRDRVLQKFTAMNKKGYAQAEIAKMIGMAEEDLDMKFKMYASLASMENKLTEVLGSLK